MGPMGRSKQRPTERWQAAALQRRFALATFSGQGPGKYEGPSEGNAALRVAERRDQHDSPGIFIDQKRTHESTISKAMREEP